MRSVIYQLGFDDFPRVRVGIGHADGQKGLIAHVLGAPEGEDREKLIAAIKDAADAAEMIVKGEILEAQARFNRHPKETQATKGRNKGR